MGLGGPEIIMISAAAFLLFGGNKLPELMKGLGKGIKEFKDAQNDDEPLHASLPEKAETEV